MGPSEAVVLGLLLGALGAAVCGSHSLHYFLTGMTDPGPGMPQFVIVGCVDGELLWNYNSLGRTVRPIMGWLPQEDQEHWDAETQKARDIELDFYEFLGRLQVHYNKSEGSHTLQKMIGCDILEDGNIRGYVQYGFDGRDYIAFDMDTMTFTAADAVAEITKRRWEQEGTYAEGCKHELGTVCVQNLRKYLEHGKAALKRRERPEVRVWGKEANGILTLFCCAYGFYPRPIAISWMKDGMVRHQETHWGGMVPNSDGTYHASAAIDVLPEDGDKYRCRVEHTSLPQPCLFSWEPQPNLIPIVAGVVVTTVAVIASVIGLVVWKSKSGKGPDLLRIGPDMSPMLTLILSAGKEKKKGYEAPAGHDGESSGSATTLV
ncbi:class I histocompatibility antigen, F10 alpha chain-like isoform X1 [Gallus gallus]|uniref:class I histocompatibility antigen, F10 alpha chain isoform X1 n=1 Tax=Gallus gallus TaxID=9031 RepID=UPI001AE848F1|nr:class I histocompatibility antigen, F10 alpha chain isoform X1 [Gallus gallus]XP_040504712.1 class I histocompatibility antigen, F10 alpha chain-like isoform X1 [Gallus gallus]XP_040504714.1 class I histocompatibility antigen, F10 alpha chain-like isoform X1 [Gallus gallus]XP_040504716.1 class I histocompatibility antigen, F10 alpha chain-like isoform X1 [Gallus gallus]XP_040513208.1 class I histocompatibility antigen, F10 alpha chain-like isoform X1 [Gallus gallus]